MITRVSEHLHSWFSSSFGRSAFSDHLLTSGHVYKGGSATLLHHENSTMRRKALKEIEIYRHLARNNADDVLNAFIPENDVIEKVYGVDDE